MVHLQFIFWRFVFDSSAIYSKLNIFKISERHFQTLLNILRLTDCSSFTACLSIRVTSFMNRGLADHRRRYCSSMYGRDADAYATLIYHASTYDVDGSRTFRRDKTNHRQLAVADRELSRNRAHTAPLFTLLALRSPPRFLPLLSLSFSLALFFPGDE